jgi:hypothetical protein
LSRNPKIEEILRRWLEWEFCESSAKANAREQLNLAILKHIGDNPYTIEQVLDALHS